jgi:hypothetical protein
MLAARPLTHGNPTLCLQEHYPGALKVALLFPASWALSAVLALGRAALHPDERSRLVALGEDEYPATLAARFAPDQASSPSFSLNQSRIIIPDLESLPGSKFAQFVKLTIRCGILNCYFLSLSSSSAVQARPNSRSLS